MGTAEGTPTYGSSCAFLFRATPRRDPRGTLFDRRPTSKQRQRQALLERPRKDLETLRTNRNASPKSQVDTYATRFAGRLVRVMGASRVRLVFPASGVPGPADVARAVSSRVGRAHEARAAQISQFGRVGGGVTDVVLARMYKGGSPNRAVDLVPRSRV